MGRMAREKEVGKNEDEEKELKRKSHTHTLNKHSWWLKCDTKSPSNACVAEAINKLLLKHKSLLTFD